MQLEFNWYLVVDRKPSKTTTGPWDEDLQDFLETDHYYSVSKEGARIYPVGGVVPLVVMDEATALVHIRKCSQLIGAFDKVITVIEYDVVMEFLDPEDPVRQHYTDLYLAYKKKQEVEDHGGKFKVMDYMNALERRDFEAMLSQRGGQ